MRRRTSSLSMLWIPESAVAHISSCAALLSPHAFLAPLSHVPCKCVDCFNAAGAWLMYRQAPLTNHRALSWGGDRSEGQQHRAGQCWRPQGAWGSGDMLCPPPPPAPSSCTNSPASAPAACTWPLPRSSAWLHQPASLGPGSSGAKGQCSCRSAAGWRQLMSHFRNSKFDLNYFYIYSAL